jgi:hypothetical protein
VRGYWEDHTRKNEEKIAAQCHIQREREKERERERVRREIDVCHTTHTDTHVDIDIEITLRKYEKIIKTFYNREEDSPGLTTEEGDRRMRKINSWSCKKAVSFPMRL